MTEGIIELKSPSGLLTCRIRPHGATVSHLIVKDPVTGVSRDVVQGFDSLEEQLAADKAANPYYGTIGRVCNRIAKGTFQLNGKTYSLPINNGPNSLHGGLQGFDKKPWKVVSVSSTRAQLSYRSADGEEGYPCALLIHITYTTKDPSEVLIEYAAEIEPDQNSTQDAIVNLTTHSYFNLSGFLPGTSPDVLGHKLKIHGPNTHLFLDSNQIPTGQIGKLPALDFSVAKEIGRDLKHVMEFRGYDHYFFVGEVGADGMRDGVEIECEEARLRLKMRTSAVGFQLYTANWMDGSLGPKKETQKDGHAYGQYSAYCLEASAPPDAINSKDEKIRNLVILKPGQTWNQATSYSFSSL
ncbi:hypothetical protein HDU97_000716 [Phlyctochytrium planicorne]|nr:hypothetical protein HDU97_000716 [Phlyctochytrium planicorne]